MGTRTAQYLLGLMGLSYLPSAVAILPPYYQSAKEIEHILHSNEVAKKLGPYPIRSIVRSKNHDDISYDITGQSCTLSVKIVYQPSKTKFVGPAEFNIIPEDICHPL